MVAITTYKNPLESAVKGYCFRSVTDQTLDSEQLVSVDAAGRECGELIFAPHDILRIKGRNLSFDATKENQGVFFVGSDGLEIRAARYNNVGTSITEVFVPGGLAPGSYKVKVVTGPRKDSLEEFTSNTPVVVREDTGQP